MYYTLVVGSVLQRNVAAGFGCAAFRLLIFFVDDDTVVAAITFLMVLFNVPSNNVLAFLFPFGAIHSRIIQIFIGGNTEDAAFTQLLCQRDDVMIKKPNFTPVPIVGRIGIGPAVDVSLVHFSVQPFVPLDVNMPMLHRMCNIRCLDDMFDDDRRLTIDLFVQVRRTRR